ncbi:hypothetical protein [Anditalea andensis]|uniref:Thiosulfate ABC transporter permease n=1 Tax=Anditalea andensis TaxID=1048983 RepID=A0A074L2R9_9BACT|nr:hypothetical protein [Anditalea andensis]KEO74780.1 thiosulfate ABC transporter permease [Anditalea andensis]
MSKVTTKLSERTEELINFDKRIFFIFLVATFILIRYLTNQIILQAIPGHEQLERDGSLTFFYIFNTFNYLWTPFALLWKFTLSAFLLWVGAFIFGHKISFRDLWKFVLVAELIFIFPELIRLLWFLVEPPMSYLEIKDFHPLSLYSLVNSGHIHPRYHYPLQAINLFELLYCVILSVGIHMLSRRSLEQSFILVICSYGIGFIVWLFYYAMVYKG